MGKYLTCRLSVTFIDKLLGDSGKKGSAEISGHCLLARFFINSVQGWWVEGRKVS